MTLSSNAGVIQFDKWGDLPNCGESGYFGLSGDDLFVRRTTSNFQVAFLAISMFEEVWENEEEGENKCRPLAEDILGHASFVRRTTMKELAVPFADSCRMTWDDLRACPVPPKLCIRWHSYSNRYEVFEIKAPPRFQRGDSQAMKAVFSADEPTRWRAVFGFGD